MRFFIKYFAILLSLSFLFISESSAASGCKKDLIYEPGVYFFATKAAHYQSHEYNNKWWFSGRLGSFDDCKKFWKKDGDDPRYKNGDNQGGYIRNWEQRRIVTKDEYCRAKNFHTWFGFGDRKHTYCNKTSSSNNSSSTSSTKIDLSWSNDRTICNNATSREGFWNYSGKMIREYREEAESRNLSLEDCNRLTGRGNSNVQNVDSTKKDFSLYSDLKICMGVTLVDGSWVRSPPGEWTAVAKSRNLSLDDCNKLTGRGSSKAQTEEKESDIVQKLKKLKKLLSDGLITQEDYDKKKAEYLENF